jgi:hypothetical protein
MVEHVIKRLRRAQSQVTDPRQAEVASHMIGQLNDVLTRLKAASR